MTRKFNSTRTTARFGFEAQMRQADFTAFRRWYDQRCPLGRPNRAELEAILSAPAEPAPTVSDTAPMRDAA